jgi:hypothetical protein
VAVFGRGTGDVRLEPALDRPKAGSVGICTNPSGTSQKNARQVTQLRRRHGHAAAGVDLDRSNSREEARRPDCVQFFVSDLPADEGCSERPRVSSEMPVPEPLAPHGMGSGIGLRRCFCHRHALRSYAWSGEARIVVDRILFPLSGGRRREYDGQALPLAAPTRGGFGDNYACDGR